MNVIVSNKYQAMLATLEIEVIKTMNGEFDVEEIISTFDNFYFQRMILDITAIKNYKDITNLQKLSIKLDMSKIILVLDDSAESSSGDYLSQLISMGIYNFTRNKEGIMYLLNHPNSYRDVAHLHKIGPVALNQAQANPKIITNTEVVTEVINQKTRIIGIKNVTDHAGSTTLTYMMKKELQTKYSVKAIQVDSHDFVYFNDKDLISTSATDFGKVLMQHNGVDIILVDLKDKSNNESVCQDVLYLIEPSIIKINSLIKRDAHIFEKLKKEKVVLNKSVLSSKDVLDFEYETKTRVFAHIPCLNDREQNHESIKDLLSKLGLNV